MLSEIYKPLIEKAFELADNSDPKSSLQELLKSDVEYVLVSQSNLNTQDVNYVIEARVGTAVLGKGQGHNRMQAETAAAKDALSKKVGK